MSMDKIITDLKDKKWSESLKKEVAQFADDLNHDSGGGDELIDLVNRAFKEGRGEKDEQK